MGTSRIASLQDAGRSPKSAPLSPRPLGKQRFCFSATPTLPELLSITETSGFTY